MWVDARQGVAFLQKPFTPAALASSYHKAVKVAILLVLLCLPALADLAAGRQALKNGDYPTALKEFLPLAKQGDASAQLLLGLMYHDGQGVPQDYREAVRWYRLAAGQGDEKGQAHLGLKYDKGEGVPQDYKEAAKWYRLAAEQGDRSAELILGLMYENGKGMPQDYIQAHMWFNLAGAAGDGDGIKGRDEVASKMTPGQIAEAQRLAREWKPKARP